MPALKVLLVPGVVEAMVVDADADERPVLESLAQTIQPFLELVLMVAVRGVGLEATEAVLRVPRESVLALRVNENACGTVALTAIWSLVTVEVTYVPESIRVGVEV